MTEVHFTLLGMWLGYIVGLGWVGIEVLSEERERRRQRAEIKEEELMPWKRGVANRNGNRG